MKKLKTKTKLMMAAGLVFFLIGCGEKQKPEAEPPEITSEPDTTADVKDTVSGEAVEPPMDSTPEVVKKKPVEKVPDQKPAEPARQKATAAKSPASEPKPDLPSPVLKILSSPAYADIVLDGKNLGSTPMKEFKKVSAGSHTINLTHRRHGKLDSTVNLKPGDSLTLKLKFDVK